MLTICHWQTITMCFRWSCFVWARPCVLFGYKICSAWDGMGISIKNSMALCLAIIQRQRHRHRRNCHLHSTALLSVHSRISKEREREKKCGDTTTADFINFKRFGDFHIVIGICRRVGLDKHLYMYVCECRDVYQKENQKWQIRLRSNTYSHCLSI